MTGPIQPLPARRTGPAEPSLLPEDLVPRRPEQAAVGVSFRMFLVALGIGVAGATALSLASLLPR